MGNRNEILTDKNRQQSITIEQKDNTIEQQLRTIEQQHNDLKSTQRDMWYKAGEELFQVYNEYNNITTGWFKTNKDKTNEKQMTENKRKLLLRAKACFQEAYKMKHTGAQTKINLIDSELSKL